MLISPGTSVTVTDESFFIPAAAATVPLIFVATGERKVQEDGTTAAAGTYESNVIRTVTSLNQSLQLYGIPKFHADQNGNQFHGDARNEFGLLALNQYLGVGNRAYVVRANINLNDNINDLQSLWDDSMAEAADLLEALAQDAIDEFNLENGYTASHPSYKETITEAELKSLAVEATSDAFDLSSFSDSFNGFYLSSDTTSGYQQVDMGGSITAGTNATNLADDTAGYQVANYIIALSANSITGLANDATAYTMTVAVDGGAAQPISVVGSAAQTWTTLLAEINADLTGATATIDSNGDLRITSDTDGPASSIAVVDTDLLSSTSYFSALLAAVVGTETIYTATISVDNGAPQTISVVGSAAQTFNQLITEITADIAGATVVITGAGNILFTSGTTGTTSSIEITDTNLFSSLNGYVELDAAVDGRIPLLVYTNGYTSPATGTFIGFDGLTADWVANALGGTVGDQWTPAEAASTLVGAADDYKFTEEFLNDTSLGANDTERRATIVTALQAAVNSNTDIRSETFEYNLILCPGYHEVVDELVALNTDIDEEAFVIADTPFDKTPSDVVTWGATPARQSNVNVAYYYPHAFMSNIDGTNVMGAASGVALRSIAYSDRAAALWYAPAGTQRGVVTGVNNVGYVSGTLGSATTFVGVQLNKGQRDDLYKDGTQINPIVFMPGRGILVWGQKTSSPNPGTLLSRINVARLLGYIKRQLRKNTLPFVFQPNDQLTRDNLKATVDGFLGDLVVKRALFDFATVSDTTNNTPDRVDRNEMYIDVAVKPIPAAEFIIIPIRVLSSGAQI